MKTIPLSQGKYAIVDDEDFPAVSRFKWSAVKDKMTFYAHRQFKIDGRRKVVKMHSFILGCSDLVDHKDGDGLNNRRCNLRLCTPHQNGTNRRKQLNTSSRFKGVAKIDRDGGYSCTIGKDGKKFWIGTFKSEEDAAIAYNVAAQLFFGEFARLNDV